MRCWTAQCALCFTWALQHLCLTFQASLCGHVEAANEFCSECQALSPCCRNGLPHVVNIAGQLIQKLKQLGPDAVVDMDNAAQRESMARLTTSDIHVAVSLQLASHPVQQPDTALTDTCEAM